MICTCGSPEYPGQCWEHPVRRAPEVDCTCGSGMHPRPCAEHPARYAEACAEISAESALDDLQDVCGCGHTRGAHRTYPGSNACGACWAKRREAPWCERFMAADGPGAEPRPAPETEALRLAADRVAKVEVTTDEGRHVRALCLLAVLAGCATVQTPTGREVRIEEARGGVIATVVSGVSGLNVEAITLPTRPPTTVYLRAADDIGLKCHERRHREQIIELGQGRFTLEYLRETSRVGYEANRFEIEARAAQEACQ